MNQEKLYNDIKRIILDAGKIITNIDQSSIDIHTKDGINNIVTNYDVLVQNKLKTELLDLLPEAGFLGEEKDAKDNINNEYVFVVDPIDGTTNFSRDLKLSAISIGLLHSGKPFMGFCYNPYFDELYEGWLNHGSYLNGKKIHVSEKTLENGLVYCGCSPYYPDLREITMNYIKKYASKAADYRRVGSAVIELCNIASGKAEVYFELRLMPWDHAAADLIVTEAGGVVQTIDGKELQYFEPTSIIATNKKENILED